MSERKLFKYWDDAKRVCEDIRRRGGVPEFSTGISFVDEATGGLHRGEIWVLSGRTGSGKTSLALNFARSFADNPKHKVRFFSLEMQGWELLLRLYCEQNGVSYLDIMRGRAFIAPEVEEHFLKYLEDIDFDILENGYKFDEVEKALDEDKSIDIVFIDFLQLIERSLSIDERIMIINYLERVQYAAKHRNVAFVIVSQLRRPPSGADLHRPPQIVDLHGSGAIEQAAHRVLFTYRTVEEGEEPKYYIDIAKNRGGPLVCKQVGFEGKFYRFYDLDEAVRQDPKVNEITTLFGGRVEE